MSHRTLLALPLALVLGAAAAQAPAPAAPQPASDVAMTDQLLGAPVTSEAGDALGTVEDVLVDAASGRLLALAIAPAAGVRADGQLTAIPPEALATGTLADAAAAQRPLRIRREAAAKLRDAPSFTRERWDEATSNDWLARMRQHFGSATEASTARPEARRLSTVIGSSVVDSADAMVGKVHAIAVDLGRREVSAAIVSPVEELGSRERLMPVPFAAMRVAPARAGARATDPSTYALTLRRDRLLSAPRFDRGDVPRLRTLLASGEAQDFYGVRPAASRARAATPERGAAPQAPAQRSKPEGARPEAPRSASGSRGSGRPRNR